MRKTKKKVNTEIVDDSGQKVEKGASAGMGTTTTSRSFQLESWAFVQHKDYQLHYLKKVLKKTSSRRVIDTTEMQRLAYFRGFCTSPFKLQRSYLQQNSFSDFFWLYISNMIFRSLPMNYLHTFLAAYNPEEHFFCSKIVPLCYGVTWQIVVSSLIQLVASADILAVLLNYTVQGFMSSSLPYARCRPLYSVPVKPDLKYFCYSCIQFMNYTQGVSFFYNEMNFTTDVKKSVNFYGNYYVWITREENGTYTAGPFFQAAPQSYLIQRLGMMEIFSPKNTRGYDFLYYYLAVWLAAAVFYKQLFKKYIWKALGYTQLLMNLIYLMSAVYIMWYFLEKKVDTRGRAPESEVEAISKEWDFDFLADSFSSPPIIQLLTARNTKRVNPARDSFIITASNGMFYMFRSLCNFKLKSYVESFLKIPVWFSHTNAYPLFNFWPWFFFHLSFGAFAARVFFLTSLLVEFQIFMITFQILIELCMCEWKWARRWIATVLLTILGIGITIAFSPAIKFIMYIVTTAITALTEVIVLCWMYPLERLTDDISFHHGTPTGFIRIWGFRLLPIYHIYKIALLYSGLTKFQQLMNNREDFKITLLYDHSSAYWAWIVGVLPLVFGGIYSFVKYVIGQGQTWRVLLRPRPDWGPREHVTRQLRKQYDTREYIGSQASRYLSRHLLAKAQTPTYRLDVKFSDDQRHSIIVEGSKHGGGSRILL